MNPDSIGPVDPGGQKWPTKVEKNLYKFMFWSVGWPLLRAEGFFYNLDILYGGLGIGKLQFLIKKIKIKISAIIFFNFWSLKPWIRIGLQPQTLDPDPDPEKMNTDPQPCYCVYFMEARVGKLQFLIKKK
jgi:hypothetical protein